MKELKEFTVERLSEIAMDPYGADLSNDEMQALAKIALAAKQADPVAWVTWHQGFRAPDDCEEYLNAYPYKTEENSCDGSPAIPVYTTPPLNHTEHHLLVPDGWKLVPIEPTEDMLKAGCRFASEHNAKGSWSQMLAAAPKPEM